MIMLRSKTADINKDPPIALRSYTSLYNAIGKHIVMRRGAGIGRRDD